MLVIYDNAALQLFELETRERRVIVAPFAWRAQVAQHPRDEIFINTQPGGAVAISHAGVRHFDHALENVSPDGKRAVILGGTPWSVARIAGDKLVDETPYDGHDRPFFTTGGIIEGVEAVSNDGSAIASLHQGEDGVHTVLVRRAGGGGGGGGAAAAAAVRVVAFHDAQTIGGCLFGDSATLVCRMLVMDEGALFAIDWQAQRSVKLARDIDYPFAPSPDGVYVAFVERKDERSRLVVANTRSAGRTIVLESSDKQLAALGWLD